MHAQTTAFIIAYSFLFCLQDGDGLLAGLGPPPGPSPTALLTGGTAHLLSHTMPPPHPTPPQPHTPYHTTPTRTVIEFFERRRVEVRHCWGMTELSPLGSLGAPKVSIC